MKYKVIENEVLRIFETSKHILLGQIIIICTDHKNLTCKNFIADKVLIWRVILEEYGLNIEYIQGSKNIVADTLPILPINGNQYTTHDYTYKK